jgi:hypothetical protein
MRLIVLLLLASSVAHADDHAAQIKALLAAQAKAQVAVDEKAFKATLTADAIGDYAGGKPTDNFGMLGGAITVPKWTITATQIGWADTWGWVVADAQITTKMYAEPEGAGDPHPTPETASYHLVELVVPDGKGVKAKVFELLRTVPDRSLQHYNETDTLVPPLKSSSAIALLAEPWAHLSDDPATSVLGTSPNDRALGLASAKKLVASWKKLGFEIVDTKDHQWGPSENVVVGDVKVVWARMRMKIKGVWYPIWGFGIVRGDTLVALAYDAT